MRSLLRSPGYTLTVLLTLALGIAANTAIFTVVNAVLLRPLPYAEPDRLVAVGSVHLRDKHPGVSALSYPDFLDLRAESKTLEGLSIWSLSRATLETGAKSESLLAITTSASFFDLLRVRPALGRLFTPDDDTPRKGYHAVLSHAGWQRLFGGDRSVLGREVRLDGFPHVIIGVLPASFQFVQAGTNNVEVWTPAGPLHTSLDGTKPGVEERGSHSFAAIGRLRPGATPEAAAAELRTIAARLSAAYPDTNTAFSAGAIPLTDEITGDARPALLVLFAAVGCVLIVACANVAGLSLVRATARRRELAIRAALGADRGRLLRELLAESLILALAAGVLGLALSHLGVDALLRLVPDSVPRLAEIRPDWTVLAFTLGASLLTGIGFGLVPAWQGARTDVNAALKDGGRGLAGGRGQARFRQALVAAQLLVSIVLLISAALLLRSFERLQRQDPGYSLDRMATFRFGLPAGKYAAPEKAADFSQRLIDALRARPEIEAAAASGGVLLAGGYPRTTIEFEGRDIPKGEQPAEAVRVVGEGYFPLLGLPVRGRDFSRSDMLTSPQVIIVNESFARKYFPGGDAIGKRIKPGISATDEEPWREIVGVIPDVRQIALEKAPLPEMFAPASQIPPSFTVVLLRTRANFANVIAAAQAELARLDPGIPLFRPATMSDHIARLTAKSRFNSLLLAIFAGVALLLTAVGVYGVMAQSVALRRGEIGLRLALGATNRQILQMVMRHAGALAAIGVVLGLGAAFASTRLLQSLLYDVHSLDPLIFAAVPALLFAVALIASLIPAFRASRVPAAEALRAE